MMGIIIFIIGAVLLGVALYLIAADIVRYGISSSEDDVDKEKDNADSN